MIKVDRIKSGVIILKSRIGLGKKCLQYVVSTLCTHYSAFDGNLTIYNEVLKGNKISFFLIIFSPFAVVITHCQ